ncbi:MAG: RNA 2'-phosphotransferase [Pseudomonadota bacterium]
MNTKKHSKRLSYVLRHAPEQVGLTLGDGGWVLIDDLLSGFQRKGWAMNRAELEQVVKTNDKKRFTVSADGLRIRAAQGHSVKIKSDLETIAPPAVLYHGTAKRHLDSILREGLRPMSRQHVHLSLDVATAEKVGQRHGTPIVLCVASGKMAAADFEFFCADNGVWLTDEVPAEFLSFEKVQDQLQRPL